MLQSFILIWIKLFCRAFPQVVIWQQVLAFSGRKDFIAQTLGVTSDMVKPNGMILSYPVITSGGCTYRFLWMLAWRGYNDLDKKNSLWNSGISKRCTNHIPVGIQWQTIVFQQKISLLFCQCRCANWNPVEMHLYSFGGHGLSLANEELNHETAALCTEKMPSLDRTGITIDAEYIIR